MIFLSMSHKSKKSLYAFFCKRRLEKDTSQSDKYLRVTLNFKDKASKKLCFKT